MFRQFPVHRLVTVLAVALLIMALAACKSQVKTSANSVGLKESVTIRWTSQYYPPYLEVVRLDTQDTEVVMLLENQGDIVLYPANTSDSFLVNDYFSIAGNTEFTGTWIRRSTVDIGHNRQKYWVEVYADPDDIPEDIRQDAGR